MQKTFSGRLRCKRGTSVLIRRHQGVWRCRRQSWRGCCHHAMTTFEATIGLPHHRSTPARLAFCNKRRMMRFRFAFARFDMLAQRCSIAGAADTIGRYGFKIAPGPATAIMLGLASPANAQAIPSTTETVAPPWNALRVFEPTPLPNLTDQENREEVPPEDMPVKSRQQPGYEPAGIRDGSWLFSPALISGAFFDSNVFSSNTLKRSDIAAVVEPTLDAHTLWEQHGIDLKLDEQSTVYSQNPGLDQTNASLKGNAWFDIAHDMAVLTSF